MVKPQQAWGIYNFGKLLSTEYRRKDAVCEVERITGKTWKDARKYIQIIKVIVTPNA